MKRRCLIGGMVIWLLTLSCDNFLTQEPETVVTNINFWKTEQDVETAVYSLHQLFRSVFKQVSVVVYRDRGLPFDFLASRYKSVCSNQLSKFCGPNDLRFDWYYEYRVIASANSVIDNISRADLSDDRYDFYLGQAYFIRAFVYFYILRTWGDAPLISASEDVGPKARTPWTEIAGFVRQDLYRALEMLPVASELKDADGSHIVSKQIPSQGTAYAVLAHLEAWVAALNQQPELNSKAIEAATQVINSGEYVLVANPKAVCEKVMYGNSEEGIFELDHRNTPDDLKDGGYLAGFCQSWPIHPLTTPATRRTNMRISNAAVRQIYADVNDKRREEYFYKLDSMASLPTSTTSGGAYIQKFRHVLAYEGGSLDGRYRTYEDSEVLIRLADIILLRAELREKTGDRKGAIADLNIIRQRAGASNYSPDEGDLKDAILLERERELFIEGIQLRYFDIVRTGTFRTKLIGDFQTLTDEDVAEGALYMPVSITAFENNTLMLQTTYWKRNGFAF